MTNKKNNDDKHAQQEELKDYLEVIKEAELEASQKQDNLVNDEFKKLQESYKETIAETEHLKDQLLRNLAEAENLRKRAAKQVEDANKFAVSNFAKDLIEVLENLYLANNIPAEALEENSLLQSISKGVEMTKTTLLSVFEKYGIKRINPNIGDNFDHNLHEAVSQIEQPEFAPNSIISVMRAGYTLHDRLLKPAMVVVAKTIHS